MGVGRYDEVGTHCVGLGKKVLVHYGGGSIKRSGVFDRIKASLEYGLPCDTRFGCNFQYHPLRRMTCSKRTLWCKTPILTQFYVSVGWSY